MLKVISSSPGELEPVFNAMLENATRICEATFGHLWLFERNAFRAVAVHSKQSFVDQLRRNPVLDLHDNPGIPLDRLANTKQVVHIPDLRIDQSYIGKNAPMVTLVEVVGARTFVVVPMLKEGELIGAISMYRQEVRPFTEKQIELVQNFAAQAVIAIENTRLLSELKQSLEQQTATSEVLKVISASPNDPRPVFQSMLENSVRICEAKFGQMFLRHSDNVRLVAHLGVPAALVEWDEQRSIFRPSAEGGLARAIRTKNIIHIDDFRSEQPSNPVVKLGGARSFIAVPMLKENEVIGVIAIYRQEVRPFTDKQIELVQNFAAQAVIAIENTRLLNELRESLQQQTATADVLKVISRSTFDLPKVLNALVESAAVLCQADKAQILRPTGKDASYYSAASYRHTAEYNEHIRTQTFAPGHGGVVGRVLLEGKSVQIPDVLADPEYTYRETARLGDYRTILGVPLLREGIPIGLLVLHRANVRPFADKQIELVETFADQAVIAIENVRLFDEVQARTRELSESLEQQTATSEVLKVISSSPGELTAVFESMLENAVRICEASFGNLLLYENDAFRHVALHNAPQAWASEQQRDPIAPRRSAHFLYRVADTKEVTHIADIALENPDEPIAKVAGARTLLIVPMLKENDLIGVIAIYRQEVRPFSDKQIELVQNFANQAVIAIENTRLLSELRQSLQQQTATADVLKVISRSTFDLRTVLQTLVESAARFCDADKATIIREKDGAFYSAEAYGFSREFMDYIKNIPIEAERGSASGRALLDGRVVHIPDVKADPEYTLADAQRLGDYRTTLCVPMLREGVPIGVLTLTRSEVRPFTDKQIELVTTFADQAAIAIENVRLFESVEARTRELAASLEDLRTTQDRLVQTQKLASLGQLTAGIAHEIKNPLNFVNNFSGVSAELIDELQEAFKDVSLNEKRRSEITELMDTLRGNLDKVMQHGKRADTIVKNMLLHSREGSGEHRLVDINTLVEESLNLAYHGARAEKQGFTITLERSLDPAAGAADVFPQDITRALLNLISNGFYAATKRKTEANGGDYEPTLTAATKNLGDRVEIRIRDNGTGVPPEVKDKMFNPFFTTKPAGEGTGLGLSISHDIIVKQHGGSIEVDTQPGEFTELRIILPRSAVFHAESGGRV